MNETMRLQKYMSQAGICSRRKAEQYIADGEVYVNGEVATIWMSITTGVDEVKLGDKAVYEQDNLVYYILNKPRGIETTCAQNGWQNVVDIVDVPERVFPVGRLDKETTWLLLLTNDGRLANYLMHPRYEHEKEYLVEVFGPITDEALESMSEGIHILGRKTKRAPVSRHSSWKFFITLSEGRNRQIRRMVEKVDHQVKKLKRIRIENIELGKLKEGQYRPITEREKEVLFKKLDIK